MLLFRYIEPDINLKVENIKIKKFPKTIDKWLKDRYLISSADSNDLNHLKEHLDGMKEIFKSEKYQMMNEWKTPESLKPARTEAFYGTYTQYCLMVDLLDIYKKYLIENRIDIGSKSCLIGKMLRTVIIIEDNNLARVLTEDINLEHLLKEKIVEYKKYGFKFSKDERSYDTV